jgi:hypothetical protein
MLLAPAEGAIMNAILAFLRVASFAALAMAYFGVTGGPYLDRLSGHEDSLTADGFWGLYFAVVSFSAVIMIKNMEDRSYLYRLASFVGFLVCETVIAFLGAMAAMSIGPALGEDKVFLSLLLIVGLPAAIAGGLFAARFVYDEFT